LTGFVFFDELPKPPGMMPMLRYKRLVTDREAARKDAAQAELDRLKALTDEDRAWLSAAGCDLKALDDACWGELIFSVHYG
jgi:hypothetical protein